VLIVDPDEDTRCLYKTFLIPRRYVVEEAADGREALAMAITDPPDVIVMETRLPGIDGYSLCELLRRDRDTKAVPIVVVTSDARPFTLARARSSGADALLVKPCLPEVLFGEMERVRQRSVELKEQSKIARHAAEDRIAESAAVLAQSARISTKRSTAHRRYVTTTPPIFPSALVCPTCDQLLHYERSFIGGVSDKFPEQWDHFRCVSGCGDFQYRHRTKQLTRKS
jgi:CheY-like chemotaxis protein